MKGRMSKWKGILVAGGVVALLGAGALNGNGVLKSTVQAAKRGYYKNDVTPPWGRIVIQGATEVDSVNYVDRKDVVVEIYASDDMCDDDEIMYYLSTSEISDTTKIASDEWRTYSVGATENVTLPNTTSMNTVYAVFKDYNGNTSLIYKGSAVEQTITYDANATDATMPTGMARKRMHGAPFVVTSQTPKRTGYFFKGWALATDATTPNFYAGDIIPADMRIGNGNTATLYALWTTASAELVSLSSVVKVGDYVNYPVYYDNVTTNGVSGENILKGWRVISKDVDIDGNESVGTVNLVSAGVPLTYQSNGVTQTSVERLAINFLTTPFHASDYWTYRKNGFNANKSLTEIFNNKYTATYTSNTTVTYPTYSTNTVTAQKLAGTLKVRAMTKEDIMSSSGIANWQSGYLMGLSDEKYDELYKNEVNYGLASANSDGHLWYVSDYGYVDYDHGREFGVRPVVSLKSTVKASGTDVKGAWNIEI